MYYESESKFTLHYIHMFDESLMSIKISIAIDWLKCLKIL